MKKTLGNHSVQEGLLFLLAGGWLLWYSLDAHSHAFNKAWAQSPSLFPLIISALLGILSVVLITGGLREEQKAERKKGGELKDTAAILGLCILYYLALSMIRLPYMGVMIGRLAFSVSVFEFATVAFLLAMMLYLKVRSVPVLLGVSLGTTVFLSVMFRTLLHVLLP